MENETNELGGRNQRTQTSLLFPDLSYKFQGACFAVRKKLGGGHKEKIYQRALAEEMKLQNLSFTEQPKIHAYYPGTNTLLGYYQPDFIIENKFIVEIKALPYLIQRAVKQIYDYLRVTKFELGYLVNFSGKTCVLKRCLMTNDRK